MSSPPSVADVVEEIFQSVLASPKRQRRLLSKTFWDKFGFKSRTQERIEQVCEALKQRSIILNLGDSTFGKEGKGEWITVTHAPTPQPMRPKMEPPPITVLGPRPPDSWFTMIQERSFESEREVEYYFIAPLLEQLGFEEVDFAIGYPVEMYQGVSRVTKEADFVMFSGAEHCKETALLVVEAKKAGRPLTEDAVGQARGYSMWLATPYYLVTNGDEIRVYWFRGALLPDLLMWNFSRNELKDHWTVFSEKLNKGAVIEYKENLRKILMADKQSLGG